jgi:DNA-directed RNA polymerase subunit beta
MSFVGNKRIRKSFGRIKEVATMPNLIEVQKQSYESFLQKDVAPEDRQDIGLEAVFRSVFPVESFSGKGQLDFVHYRLDPPKHGIDECRRRDLTYAAPLRVTMRLIVWDVDEDTDARSIHDIKEQDVYMGDIPLMTPNGTFIFNGTERVVVSQMHRSPGVFFDHDGGKNHVSGKYIYSSRIIPHRGSWLDFEFDTKDLLNVRIDCRRKMPVTTFLMALDNEETATKKAAGEKVDKPQGMSHSDILALFYETFTCRRVDGGWTMPYIHCLTKGMRVTEDTADADTGEILLNAGDRVTARTFKIFEEKGIKNIFVKEDELLGRFVSHTIIHNKKTVLPTGGELTSEILETLACKKCDVLSLISTDRIGPYLRNTLMVDKNQTREESLIDIYRVMRPGEPPTIPASEALFDSLFFDADRYDLSAVGRVKMNARLGIDCNDSTRTLRREDILLILKTLLDLKNGHGDVDDIDHLGNRRVRAVGELLENQYRAGLVRVERAVKERMAAVEIDAVMPHDILNAKPAISAVREFFGSSQLSQFMDQTNPLGEITHKRRLSALGPGGLTRDRASFEVRDVHTTHYGRICPIETPEGPNIGLINSLATYARVNRYGFIESPYRVVLEGRLTDDVRYISAMEETHYIIAQADVKVDDSGCIVGDLIKCRQNGDLIFSKPEDINFIDVSPKQTVSVAASLIPFLENDDSNRALMGSNMQRQSVPLLRPEAPLVGTGMEASVAQDSGAVVTCRRDGVVVQVDASRIVIKATEITAEGVGVDIYTLKKFERSNQDTCINQRPLVKVGDNVRAGDIVADGHAIELGELALGQNALVAFLSWNGYNFEDSILISERLVQDDKFTSIHIEEFEVVARDTKLGQEQISRDIPNVSEESLRHLDEVGIVYIGAEVKAGDILVGKVTPKGETVMTPEEKLLRAVFGDKATDVRDSSLRVPPGIKGTIVDVRVFNRRGVDKDERSLSIEQQQAELYLKDRDDENTILRQGMNDRLNDWLNGQTIVSAPRDCGLKKGQVISPADLTALSFTDKREVTVVNTDAMDLIEGALKNFDLAIVRVQSVFEDRLEKLQRGDDLTPGVMKMVKVFVAVKRKLQPGDKMAGRHGNKGVVSKILPVEDMPYLADGTPVDIVLTPLGIPSRMNMGQILETHLGWASAGMGKHIGRLLDDYKAKPSDMKTLKNGIKDVYETPKYAEQIDGLSDDQVLELAGNLTRGVPVATPVFDGAYESDVTALLKKYGRDPSGQELLYDGKTGRAFDRKVTVGYMYMLKLDHLVDNKIHARSIGPYSLVTQQPLGGKAQFGGQRFGEMEVWALEAYGAAYTLQEMLTVKSDDTAGRMQVYESIVRGDNHFDSGIPESFNVLVNEMRALGLDVKLNKTDS